MSLANLAVLGSQALLGLVGLGVGGAKVSHQEDQVEAFRRYGYPQWFRIVTGAIEVGAGLALIGGLMWRPELGWVGGALLGGVMAGAVATHLRTDDPPSKTAVPAVFLLFTAALFVSRYLLRV